MNDHIFSYLLIPVLVFLAASLGKFMRAKFAKPDVKDGVQKAGRFERMIANVILTLAVLMLALAVFGVVLKEGEMALVCAGIGAVFFILYFIIKKEYAATYFENEEYFILKAKNKEVQVYYKDIVDWEPAFNEIVVLDETKPDSKYIHVNISIFEPKILLQKIVEMTFAGKFYDAGSINIEDPYREQELIDHLQRYNYGYLVEKYTE